MNAVTVQVANSILQSVFIVVVGIGYYYSTMAIRSQVQEPALKNVERWTSCLVTRFLAGSSSSAISLLGILVLAGAMTWVTASLMDIDLSLRATAEGYLNLWPISLAFGGLAMLCSAIFRRRALAIAIPGLVLFGMYLLDTLGNISDDIEDYKPLSAFHYYGSAILEGIDWANFAGLTTIAGALILLALLVFQRREIYT